MPSQPHTPQLKALFLDMDETLCDTTKANRTAQQATSKRLADQYDADIDTARFVDDFLKGIYKEWSPQQREYYQPYRERHGELAYRQKLVQDLLQAQGIDVDAAFCEQLHLQFEQDRMAAFDFFAGIKEFLTRIREHFTLVVITNGPEFSQVPKIQASNLAAYVDHIIIGGQEPEQKPAASIFNKALALANCASNEVIHFGDSLDTDIAGANALGIRSVWIQHEQAAKAGITPSDTLQTPEQIPAFVDSLS